MLVVGLSGVTCGGKTSLSAKLAERLECSVLHQDTYFLGIDDPRHEFIPSLGHINWELLTSMDMPAMLKDTQEAMKCVGRDVLLIEGHTVLNYEPIAKLCHVKFYLTLEREECKRRREGRVYDPADVPGYFDQVVWSEHERMKKDLPDVIWLDGTRKQEELVEEILEEVARARAVHMAATKIS